MRFLIVDSYYKPFLDAVYTQNSQLSQQPYDIQWRTLMDQCFGTADFYSANLQRLGHEAKEVVANCRPLQLQWAREQGLPLRHKIRKRVYRGFPMPGLGRNWFYPVLFAQVKSYRPDVIHFQDPGNTDPVFLREIRPYVRMISAQIASPIPQGVDFGEYDLVLSSLPHFVRRFHQQGLRSACLSLGFEPQVLTRVKRTSVSEVIFVGGLSRSHASRIKFLEQVAHGVRLDWWGYGVENLASDSPLRETFHGPAWGLAMYEKLFNARITLNHHIDVAENYANNMRLFEATGAGSLLLTDLKDNLHHLFELRTELVAYRSSEECIEFIQYYLHNQSERDVIAGSGQQRTLKDHNYHQRMRQYVELLNPLLS